MKHVRLENDRYVETIDSGLNNCLSVSANIDQTGRAFIQDTVMSMFDEGCVALVPIEASANPNETTSFDVLSIRTAKIIQWYPEHVRLDLYNDRNGRHEELTLPKSVVAIVENPFYEVMNKPNSTLQRLRNKLALLDLHIHPIGGSDGDLTHFVALVNIAHRNKAHTLPKHSFRDTYIVSVSSHLRPRSPLWCRDRTLW